MKSAAVGIIVAVLCCGCASPIVVKPQVPEGGTRTPTISETSVILPDEASVDLPVGVFPLGRFTQRDMSILQDSIVRSLANLDRHAEASTSNSPRLIIVIRSLVNQYSNNSGYLFGCIAYCLADQEGKILYQDQFYTRAEGHIVVTPGMALNAFNKRVAKRIVGGVLAFYDQSPFPQAPVDGTFDKFEDAARTMPKTVSSYYTVKDTAGTKRVASATDDTTWHVATRSEPIEWSMYLKH